MPERWLLDAARAIAVGLPAGIMGIVNVTPDSFSDGGRHAAPAQAVQLAQDQLRQGADWIDVGGESTRPGAEPVPEAEELARVVPAIRAIRAAGVRLPLSVDTRHGAVAEAALAAGASAVNDISGGADPRLLDACASARCPLVLMHMQGDPRTMQAAPRYADVVDEVAAGLESALRTATARGVAASAIVLDPGIGFGKTPAHNLALLAALPRLAHGRPLLVGISRKSLIGAVTGIADPRQRDAAGHALHAQLAPRAALLRVHDVAGARAALRLRAALEAAHG
jgi:dihydropteroate synthase